MVNRQYEKGRRKEYKVKKMLEAKGMTVIRSAGSHSFADLVAIDPKEKIIHFIQCKPARFSDGEVKKLMEENIFFNMGHVFEVCYKVV